MPRFINPFSDWGFKKIFGQEINKDLLIKFLNDLLDGEHHITDLVFKDKEQLPELVEMRGIIYDIYCTTDKGEHIIVRCRTAISHSLQTEPSIMPRATSSIKA